MKKTFTPHEKAKIALEAARGLKTPNQIAGDYEAHPVQIGFWKKRLTQNAHLLFSEESKRQENDQNDLIERLYKTVGERQVEIDWLKKKLHLES